MRTPSHGILPSVSFGGLLLAAALPAAAGDVEFNPTLALGAAYNSNIDVLAATERSAGSLRLSADLPLRYRTGRDTLTASYRPARTNFEGDNGADDFTAHALSLTWDRTVSRRADFTMSARAVRSESQEISEDKPDAALTFVERTQIDRYEFSVGGSVQTGQRSNVSWDGGLRVQKFEDLPGTDFIDSRGASVGLGWTAQTGANTSNGVSYRYGRAEFEDSLATAFDESFAADAHTVTWTTGSRIGRTITTSVGLGVSYGKSREGSDTVAAFDATLTRQIGEVSSLSAGVRQGFAPGGGTTGVTQDLGAFLSWQYAPRVMAVGLTAGWWRREPTSFGGTPSAPASQAWSVAANFAWQFGRWVALGVSGNYSKQEDPDTTFGSYGLYLRYNIRGR